MAESRTPWERFAAVQDEFDSVKEKGADPRLKYAYRNVEKMYVLLKKLLKKHGFYAYGWDELVECAGVPHVVSHVKVTDGNGWSVEGQSAAQEWASQPGIVPAQISGQCSTYSAKYALCRLFLIDDGSDPDGFNYDEAAEREKPTKEQVEILKSYGKTLEGIAAWKKVKVEKLTNEIVESAINMLREDAKKKGMEVR